MTRRSSHPCREWEGPSSPRCSQKPRMPCSDAITPRCAVWQESRPSPSDPEGAASSSGDRPATTASPTPSTTGRVSPFSTIRAAASNMPNSDAEVIAMAGRCDRSPTASSTSPAPCSNPAPPSTRPQPLKNPLDKRWGVPSAKGVRRERAALSSGCEPHPAKRSSRKQPEQSWR